tara:strand:+ start:937 stop:1251 length:315 start_codon:yes stop_codon:yes gene_type:complete
MMNGDGLDNQTQQTIRELIERIQTADLLNDTAREVGETAEMLADRFMHYCDDHDIETDSLRGVLNAWNDFVLFLEDEDADEYDDEEDDGHPSETTEWGDFDPDC